MSAPPRLLCPSFRFFFFCFVCGAWTRAGQLLARASSAPGILSSTAEATNYARSLAHAYIFLRFFVFRFAFASRRLPLTPARTRHLSSRPRGSPRPFACVGSRGVGKRVVSRDARPFARRVVYSYSYVSLLCVCVFDMKD